MPTAAASWGSRLVGVMPGRVLISKNQGVPSSVTIKSAREYTDSPRARNTVSAASPSRFSHSSGMGAGQNSSAAPGWYLFS